MEVPALPSEVEDKDLLEPDRLKAVEAKWAGPYMVVKVKLRELNVGDLFLLRSPHTESSGKLEAKWAGPYVVMKESRLGVCRLSYPQGKMLQHSWNADSLRCFFV
jgi:hypothetical protein